MKRILLIAFTISFINIQGIFCNNAQLRTFVTNFKRSEYQAMSQNWAIDFDHIGRAYFGNSGGVLEYDGKNWKLHQHRSKSAIRSLLFDESVKRLYSGCYEDFGYWSRDTLGVLNYFSLGELLLNHSFKGERIWSIVKSEHEILFQSFSSLYVYNTLSGSVEYIDPKGELLFLNKVNDKIYTRLRGIGIATYENKKFKTINDSEFAKSAIIRFFISHRDGIILGDGKTGLHLLKNDKIEPWNVEANRVLRSKDVNSAVRIDSETIAIGTLQGGLFIINNEGEILSHLDRQSKLENNTVLGVSLDRSGDLWLGMDNGISHVELNSAVEYNIDLEFAPSAIYSVVKHNGFVYVGTNNGILYSRFNKDLTQLDFKMLKPLPKVSGHIWKLEVLNGELLCGNNEGIYQIKDHVALPLSLNSGGTDFTIFRHQNNDWLVESTYYKIRIHKRVNNQWVYSHLVDGFQGSCKFIEIDHAGYVWVSHEIKGLTRLKLSDDLKTVVSSKEFGTKTGLPADYGLNVFKVNNRVVITTGEEIYTYDDLSEQILPYKKLNQALGRFKKAVRIVNKNAEYFWVITENEAALVNNLTDTIHIQQTLSLSNQYSFPDKYQNISIADSSSILCLENGIAIVPFIQPDSVKHHPLIISKVFNRKRGIENKGVLLPNDPTVPQILKKKNNTIEFTLTAVNFEPNKLNYQYRIENLIDDWVDNQSNNVSEIKDIPVGEYTYQARVLYSNGEVSNIVEYPFEILSAWYASRLGVAIIISLILGSIIFIIVFNQRIIRIQTTEIEQKHKDQHKQNESTIQQLRNDVLKKELENLQSKLTLSANALVEKDKSISTIKGELQAVYKRLEGRFPQRDYKKIIKVIEGQMTQKRDMLDFEQHFAASQSGFYDKLRTEYPELSPGDLRLCSLLKMNMNSKEISVLLGITVRSVEVSRYRLRKKMGLSPEENLTNKIMEF